MFAGWVFPQLQLSVNTKREEILVGWMGFILVSIRARITVIGRHDYCTVCPDCMNDVQMA